MTIELDPELFLPEPDPREVRYTIISVDDHVVEPGYLFERYLPSDLRERGPQIVANERGQEVWHFEGQVFQQVWKRVDPQASDDPPKPLQSEYRLRKILVAAMVQGAIFSVVRALIDRGGARAFERWTGEWPGD